MKVIVIDHLIQNLINIFLVAKLHINSPTIFYISIFITLVILSKLISRLLSFSLNLFLRIFFPSYQRRKSLRQETSPQTPVWKNTLTSKVPIYESKKQRNKRIGDQGEKLVMETLNKISNIEIWDNLVFGTEDDSTQIDFLIEYRDCFVLLEAKNYRKLSLENADSMKRQITRHYKNIHSITGKKVFINPVVVFVRDDMEVEEGALNNLISYCYLSQLQEFLSQSSFKPHLKNEIEMIDFKFQLEHIKSQSTPEALERHSLYWEEKHGGDW